MDLEAETTMNYNREQFMERLHKGVLLSHLPKLNGEQRIMTCTLDPV